MNKQMTIVVAGIILTANAAKAFTPGIYYHSGEMEKTYNHRAYTKEAKRQAARYDNAMNDLFEQEEDAFKKSMKAHHYHRRMKRAQKEFFNATGRVNPYPEYDYHKESVHATLRGDY